jgi:hypothetical protein
VAEIDTGLTVSIGGATSHVQGPSFDGVTLSLGAIACGTNEAPPAIAVAGNSVTDVGVKGTSDEGVGVWASGSPAGHFESSKGYCVEAVGTADVDAINATTSSPHHAALAGHNNGGGYGLWVRATGPNPSPEGSPDTSIATATSPSKPSARRMWTRSTLQVDQPTTRPSPARIMAAASAFGRIAQMAPPYTDKAK